MTLRSRQRGVALLVAILLVALGTILAASIAFQSAIAARRGIASLSFEQSVRVAQGAEALAAYGFRQDSNVEKDDYSESWAQPLPPTEITPGVILEARVEDLAGRFNLNSLVDANGVVDKRSHDAFERLLGAVGLEPKWADQMVDWIDGDSNENGFDGLEDGGTTNQAPPYRVANTRIVSTSELLALPGFGRERYLKIAPYVTALPPKEGLNICTAPGLVLDALIAEGYHDFGSDPKTLEKNREKGCFPVLANYKEIFKQENPADPKDPAGLDNWLGSHFSENSHYFRLTSIVTLGGSDFALYSLLQRSGTGQQGKVHVVQRSFTPD